MFKIPTKKLKSGFEMPIYGLGTWQITGSRKEPNPQVDKPAVIKNIQETIDQGVTHIDTAELYGGGQVEEVLGEAITKYDRSKLFITSKVQGANLKYNSVLQACQKSLHRLQADYLDLYLIHWREESIPLEETLKAMNELVDQGLVKNIGVSNFTKESLIHAQLFSRHKIVVNQVHYNLIYREPEPTGLLKYCQNNDVLLEAWRPVQYGQLAAEDGGLLDELSIKYKKTPVQIAINWLISQTNVITLAKTSSLDHLQENLGALDWQMETEDIERLRKEYPEQLKKSDAVPLG
jgi:diketogulonate reductase-like aldo/keto reductase